MEVNRNKVWRAGRARKEELDEIDSWRETVANLPRDRPEADPSEEIK